MREVALRAVGLSFAYSDHDGAVLREVDVDVAPRTVTAVTGPSGSGKSTLLHCLAGLLHPTSGEVRVGDLTLTSLREPRLTRVRRDLFGFVFQSPGLLDELDGQENVALAARLGGLPHREARQRAQRLLVDLGITPLARRLPSGMSGGQAQRVAVARALVNGPAVIFADEPTGALDQANGAAVIDLLHDARDRGAAVVLVTHDQGLAARADHQIHLVDGRRVA